MSRGIPMKVRGSQIVRNSTPRDNREGKGRKEIQGDTTSGKVEGGVNDKSGVLVLGGGGVGLGVGVLVLLGGGGVVWGGGCKLVS